MKGTIPQGLGSYTRPASLETHPPPAQIATPPLQVSGTARPSQRAQSFPSPPVLGRSWKDSTYILCARQRPQRKTAFREEAGLS